MTSVPSELEAPSARPHAAVDLGPPPSSSETPRGVPQSGLRHALDALSTWLPLLLMAVLALGSWWLVKNTPLLENDRGEQPARHVPDYTMTHFLVQRFGPQGGMTAQLEGDVMRHYPDTDTVEIDNPRIRAIGKDGQVMVATARSALSNKDASEVQLSGDAHVVREATPTAAAIDFRSDFLHCIGATETVKTHLPVVVTQGETEVRGDSMVYENLSGIASFGGKVHAVLVPPPGR